MSELTDKEKKVVGQRIAYLDYLLTNAIREFGDTGSCYSILRDILVQMITLANAIGIDAVTLSDLDERIDELLEKNKDDLCYCLPDDPKARYII